VKNLYRKSIRKKIVRKAWIMVSNCLVFELTLGMAIKTRSIMDIIAKRPMNIS